MHTVPILLTLLALPLAQMVSQPPSDGEDPRVLQALKEILEELKKIRQLAEKAVK